MKKKIKTPKPSLLIPFHISETKTIYATDMKAAKRCFYYLYPGRTFKIMKK